MTYEEFKIALTAEVTNLVGEEVDVHIHKVKKINGVVLDAISILYSSSCSSPSIYLIDLYENFECGMSLMNLAYKVIEISKNQRHMSDLPKDFYSDFYKIRHRICYRLVNYEKNRELLKDLPHEKVMDLAKVYFYYVEPDIIKNATIMIRKRDLVRFGVSEKELKKYAEENTPKLLPWTFDKMQNVVTDICDELGLCEEFPFDEEHSIQLYILSNKEKYFGASCIFYPHVLEKIADRLDSHFYILPSSIHECIIMPINEQYSLESLSNIVAEINEEHLDVLEVLSDKAYYYDKNVKAIIA